MAYTIGPDGRRYYNGQRDNEEGRHNNVAKTVSRTPWGWVVVVIIIICALGAFIYNRAHVSEEERTIDFYMEEQMEQDSTTTGSTEEYIIGDCDI